jgi:YcxB-like protein
MISNTFTYYKPQVIQALRYHFISRKEIKLMMILVNLLAIGSAILYFTKKISPFAFMVCSFLWFFLMILYWFVLPQIIYRQSATFKDEFAVTLGSNNFTIENDKGQRSWEWSSFSSFMESPHFFHLYFNPRSFFIVPKLAFNANELAEAKAILSEKIKGR